MPWSKGDRFEVTDATAPFAGATGVIEQVDTTDPFPLISNVTSNGNDFPCSYKESEVTLLAEMLVLPECPAANG